jgi:L-lysine 2,3-aminomutase
MVLPRYFFFCRRSPAASAHSVKVAVACSICSKLLF